MLFSDCRETPCILGFLFLSPDFFNINVIRFDMVFALSLALQGGGQTVAEEQQQELYNDYFYTKKPAMKSWFLFLDSRSRLYYRFRKTITELNGEKSK
ncbi:hypothetical protein AN963_08865 [Brevibacillus choshinensis]|uniref:Uncharacterized protein n=1 Tax=Brevibacillus choshinensis TaxID=54911 RepID=A0ABR5NE05_BRECH|nr:hypothetical protein AN963_08865 [Brevibacillus choshinensis]